MNKYTLKNIEVLMGMLKNISHEMNYTCNMVQVKYLCMEFTQTAKNLLSCND